MTSMRTASTPATPAAGPAAGSPLISPQRRNLIFVAIVLGMLLAALDQTIVATALPTIVADLGDAGHQSWVVTSYLLASTIVTALVGKLGDLFGRKRVFQAAVVFFVVGSISCGLAQSMAMLVAARALQGIGGGGITVTASALIGQVVPLRERGRYQGMLGAVFGVTTVVGPLLGGYFTDYLTWRWAFWVNVPISVVVIVVAAAAIPALAATTKPVIDYAGIAFIGLGAALTLATSWGGTLYPWGSATIIGLFGGAAVALGIFVAVERRASEPILPLRLFGSPVFTVCCVLSFVVGFAMLGAMTFLPTYMQYVDGVSATTSGLRTLPMVAGMLITSTGSGTIVGRTGRYKIFPVAGTALMALAFLLMSGMDPSTSALLQSVYLVVLGAGIGLSMQVLILIVQNTSNFEDLGVATSGVTFFRTIGSSFGAAIFGSLFVNFLRSRLGPALIAGGVRPDAVSSPGPCTGSHTTWPRRSWRPTPIRSPKSSSGRRRSPWSVSSWHYSCARCRCGIFTTAQSISATPSGCRPPKPPIRCWRAPSRACCAASPVCACAASPCGPIAGSTSPACGVCSVSTATRRCTGRLGSPTWPTICGYLSRFSSPSFLTWWQPVTCSAKATKCGSPRRGPSRSTTCTRCWWPGSSTSWPVRPASRADRTVARWKRRSSASRDGFWPNGIGMPTRRQWPSGPSLRSLAPRPKATTCSPEIPSAGVPSRHEPNRNIR